MYRAELGAGFTSFSAKFDIPGQVSHGSSLVHSENSPGPVSRNSAQSATGQVSRNFGWCCAYSKWSVLHETIWSYFMYFNTNYLATCGGFHVWIHIRFSNSFQLHILSTFPGVELNSSFLNVTDGTCFMNYSYNKQVEPCSKSTRYWLIHFITVFYEKKI